MTRIPIYVFNTEEIIVNIQPAHYITREPLDDYYLPLFIISKIEVRYFNVFFLKNVHLRS